MMTPGHISKHRLDILWDTIQYRMQSGNRMRSN